MEIMSTKNGVGLCYWCIIDYCDYTICFEKVPLLSIKEHFDSPCFASLAKVLYYETRLSNGLLDIHEQI